MVDILLDANMLLVPFQRNVDVFAELERLFDNPTVYTLDRCIDEAKHVEDGEYANLVEKLVETQDLTVIETGDTETHVDTLLVEYAENGYVIATNDTELRSTLEEDGWQVIYLRSNAHLAATPTTAF